MVLETRPLNTYGILLYMHSEDIKYKSQIAILTQITYLHTIYSKTSKARTPMARLPWLIRTRF